MLRSGIIILFMVLLSLTSRSAEGSMADTVRAIRSDAEVLIDRIFIVGNKVTKDHIILREVDFSEGDRLKYEELKNYIDRIEEKIFNTNLFNTVDIEIVELTSQKVDVLIRVTERWYFFPIPILKLVDRNFNDWWQNQNADLSRLEYGIKLYHYNMRGRMERLLLNIQFGFTKRFGIQYRIPYFDRKQQHGVEVLANYNEQTNVAFRTIDHKQKFLDLDDVARQVYDGAIIYTFRKNFFDFHSASLRFRSTTVADSVIALNSNYFGSGNNQQRYFRLEYNYVRDYRDVVAYPLHGYKLQLSAAKVGLGIYDDIDLFNIRGAYIKYFDLTKGFFASNYSSFYLSFPRDQPYANYYGLGYGTNFVRGYELNLIEGQNFLLNKSSLKFRILSGETSIKQMPLEQFRHFPYAIYLKTYFDVGYVSNFENYEINDRLTDTPVYGFGFGVDIHTFYDFVGRLEYSFNDQGENGFFIHFRKDF